MNACKNCIHKPKCTKAKYRAVQDGPNEKYARIVDKRTKENIELYRKRQQLVEHPFGTVKRALGVTYFFDIQHEPGNKYYGNAETKGSITGVISCCFGILMDFGTFSLVILKK